MLGRSDKEECEGYKQGNVSSQRTSPRHYLHTWDAENKPKGCSEAGWLQESNNEAVSAEEALLLHIVELQKYV